MSLAEAGAPVGLAPAERRILLELARASVAHGLTGQTLNVHVADYPPALQQRRATFVTLYVAGELHGCIGSLEAYRALALDVIENAHQAAFADPRFARLTRADFAELDVHISILSPSQPLQFVSEDDLLRQLRPGIDGLILTDGEHHGTFLPAVWDSLPVPREFLRALKGKAGLTPDYWSDSIVVERYTTESVP